MEASKSHRQVAAMNKRMTREAGLLNFQLVVTPYFSGDSFIHANWEDKLTKWCMKTLFAQGLEKKVEDLAIRGTQVNFISTTRERSRQLKKSFKCPLPPFSSRFPR